VASSLQDYSKVPLSREFTENFATQNFSSIVEDWILTSSKTISLFVVALAKESKIRSIKKSTEMITNFLADNINVLEWQLRDERERRTRIHEGISDHELGFLAFEPNGYPIHETLCIFDWVHYYSRDRFSFENDGAIIHLLFDVSQRNIGCDCEFFPDNYYRKLQGTEKMLTIRLETPRSFETPETYFQKWTRLLGLLNEPVIQQRWGNSLT
jgi:hypothetical protein